MSTEVLIPMGLAWAVALFANVLFAWWEERKPLPSPHPDDPRRWERR